VTDRDYTTYFVDPENNMMNLIDNCLYEGSSDDVSNLIQVKYQQNLDEVISIVDGFGYDSNAVNITDEMPPSFQVYQDETLPNLRSYVQDDFLNSTIDSPVL